MARPIKEGILFFSIPCDFFSDPLIKRLERQFPGQGICLYFRLRCDGHSRKGYYVPLDEDSIFNIIDDLRIDDSEFNEILSFMIEKKIFVEIEHPKFGRVITNEAMQRDYQAAVDDRIRKRKERNKQYTLTVDESIWLLSKDDTDERICPRTIP